jgi:hypothetical protein
VIPSRRRTMNTSLIIATLLRGKKAVLVSPDGAHASLSDPASNGVRLA